MTIYLIVDYDVTQIFPLQNTKTLPENRSLCKNILLGECSEITDYLNL